MDIEVNIVQDGPGGWESWSFADGTKHQGHCWLYDPWEHSDLSAGLRALCQRGNAAFRELCDQVLSLCEDTNYEHACILQRGANLLAVVDHIQSEPLYYTVTGDTLCLSNDPSQFFQSIDPVLVEEALREFLLANYVTGKKSLLRGVQQILAGQALIFSDGILQTESVCEFWHRESAGFQEDLQRDRFRELILEVVEEMIGAYPEHRIILTLSGGLDSRLILWALDQLDHPDVVVCSYGRSFQRDVKWAREFTARTRYPWIFIPLSYKALRRIFQSEERRNYSRKSHFFTRLPFIQDFPALLYLSKRGYLEKPAIGITGNSGDYISGGHIQEGLSLENSRERVIDAVIHKHFHHWDINDLAPQIQQEYRQEISSQLDHAPESGRNEANFYEWWEWRERQSKFVVNSRRQYHWFGIPLFLPLWDKRMMQFFEEVPLNLRRDQRFYKRFCRNLVTSRNFAFDSVPTTLAQQQVEFRRKILRAIEHIANPNWGRYNTAALEHMFQVAHRLIGPGKGVYLPTTMSPYIGLLLWELVQNYPIRRSESKDWKREGIL